MDKEPTKEEAAAELLSQIDPARYEVCAEWGALQWYRQLTRRSNLLAMMESYENISFEVTEDDIADLIENPVTEGKESQFAVNQKPYVKDPTLMEISRWYSQVRRADPDRVEAIEHVQNPSLPAEPPDFGIVFDEAPHDESEESDAAAVDGKTSEGDEFFGTRLEGFTSLFAELEQLEGPDESFNAVRLGGFNTELRSMIEARHQILHVDMLATDEILVESFRGWLKDKRQELLDHSLQTPLKPKMAKWAKNFVLPYLDIQILSEFYGVHVSQHLIGRHLLPDDKMTSEAEWVRFTVKKSAEEALDHRVLKGLAAWASEEKAE